MLLCGNDQDVGVEFRVADLLVRALMEGGVDTFYGVPGGAIAPVYDALLERMKSGVSPPVRLINTRHETGAVFMAAGQSRAGGTLPCVLVTSGPGITNALTGIASAWSDRVPLVILAGEVSRGKFGHGALQEGHELDLLGMVRRVTKFATELNAPQNATSLLQKALSIAVSDRPGPVFLSLPIDVTTALVKSTVGGVHIDESSLCRATKRLQECRRGAIFVGSGASDPRTVQLTVKLVARLAETLQMPVMTTPKAKGLFPEDHPLSLGVYGYGGHPSARRYFDKAVDVLLCVGCGLNETGTNNWSPKLAPKGAFIQVDIDPAQIGRNYPVDIALIGHAHDILEKIIERVQPRPVDLSTAPHYGVEVDELPPESNAGLLHPAHAVRMLQARAPKDTIFASDIGEHLLFALHYLRVNEPGGFVASLGLGSMGSGIGGAIGVKIAKPDRPVVVICGDYGFQMSGMEVATCRQSKIGVVFAVFNDARMGMVENGNMRVFGQTTPMDSSPIDFAKLAKAHGVHGFSLSTREDFEKLPGYVFTAKGPTILDIKIDPKASFANNGRSEHFSNFVAKPAPNDDNGGT